MPDAKPSEIVPVTAPAMPRSDDLATRINAAHEEVKNSIRRGAEHAIKAGHLLLQAKETVGHGVFLEWVGRALYLHTTHRAVVHEAGQGER
jgi:hypothetical protein